MSALGHEQTCASQKAMSALPPIATEIADIVAPNDGRVPFPALCVRTSWGLR